MPFTATVLPCLFICIHFTSSFQMLTFLGAETGNTALQILQIEVFLSLA